MAEPLERRQRGERWHLSDGKASASHAAPPVRTRYNVGKTYLLFQEFYGHAGVENRGRNFGPAPWLARALDVPPACPTRRPGSACLGAARLGTACHRPAPRTRLAAARRAWPRPPWVCDAVHTPRQRAWRAQTPVVAYVHPDPSARTLTASPDSTGGAALRGPPATPHTGRRQLLEALLAVGPALLHLVCCRERGQAALDGRDHG